MAKLQDGPVHFHSSDDRFCRRDVGIAWEGGPRKIRCFSFKDDEITCPHCLANYDRDAFVLSPDGRDYLASLPQSQ